MDEEEIGFEGFHLNGFSELEFEQSIYLVNTLLKMEGFSGNDEEATKAYHNYRPVKNFLESRNTVDKIFRAKEKFKDNTEFQKKYVNYPGSKDEIELMKKNIEKHKKLISIKEKELNSLVKNFNLYAKYGK